MFEMFEIARKAHDLVAHDFKNYNLTELKYANVDFAYGEVVSRPETDDEIFEIENAFFHEREKALAYTLHMHEHKRPTKYSGGFPEYSWDLKSVGGNTNKTIKLPIPILTNIKIGEDQLSCTLHIIYITKNKHRFDQWVPIAIIDESGLELTNKISNMVKSKFRNYSVEVIHSKGLKINPSYDYYYTDIRIPDECCE